MPAGSVWRAVVDDRDLPRDVLHGRDRLTYGPTGASSASTDALSDAAGLLGVFSVLADGSTHLLHRRRHFIDTRSLLSRAGSHLFSAVTAPLPAATLPGPGHRRGPRHRTGSSPACPMRYGLHQATADPPRSCTARGCQRSIGVVWSTGKRPRLMLRGDGAARIIQVAINVLEVAASRDRVCYGGSGARAACWCPVGAAPDAVAAREPPLSQPSSDRWHMALRWRRAAAVARLHREDRARLSRSWRPWRDQDHGAQQSAGRRSQRRCTVPGRRADE